MSVLAPADPATESEPPVTVERQITERRPDPKGAGFHGLLLLALGLSLVVLVVLLADVIVGGWDVFSGRFGDFLGGGLASQPGDAGIKQGLVGTFWIGVFVIVIAFPMGVAAAIYLEEYATKGRFTRMVDVTIRNLAGVPSVVYGILGLTIFVNFLRPLTGPDAGGRTLISAGLTLAILVLPIVIITSAEALRAVPTGLREAGFGVGATRWEVVRHHVLPYAAPGILTGTVLSLARALGEAAPLILVGATTGYLTSGDEFLDISALQERFVAMPTLIKNWAGLPGSEWEANTAAAIVVLLAVVLLANTAAIVLRNHFESKRR